MYLILRCFIQRSNTTHRFFDNKILGQGEGYFMHASTASGKEGDSAWLETKRMIATRGCHVQCLQFYYYHSGRWSDQLNIWIREFRDEWDQTGTRRLVGQITGNLKLYDYLVSSALKGI